MILKNVSKYSQTPQFSYLPDRVGQKGTKKFRAKKHRAIGVWWVWEIWNPLRETEIKDQYCPISASFKESRGSHEKNSYHFGANFMAGKFLLYTLRHEVWLFGKF